MERTGGDGDKDGVSRDRMMLVHHPKMRHSYKISSWRFDGKKAAIVVDTGTHLNTATAVLSGKAPDNLGALGLVEERETATDLPVEEAMVDAAYGGGGTRQSFADAGRRLVAPEPGRPNRKRIPKDDFVIDLAAGSSPSPSCQREGVRMPRVGSTTCRLSSSKGRQGGDAGTLYGSSLPEERQ